MSKAKLPQLLCTRTGLIQDGIQVTQPMCAGCLNLRCEPQGCCGTGHEKKWERVDQQSDVLEGGIN